MNEPKDNSLQTVTIYKPHTHAGKRLRPGPNGIQIQVNEHDAKFLKDAGVLDKPAIDAAGTAAGTTRPGTTHVAGGAAANTPHGTTRPQG